MNSLEKQFFKAYEKYSDAIFRHCYFRVFNKDKAKDLTQEAFMRTWQYLVGGAEVEIIRAFLYRVANNLVIDYVRKKKEQSLDRMREDQGFDPADESKDRLIRLLEGGEIIRVLNKLPSKYREVIQMKYLDDLDIKEIASALEETENNVSVRLHRGIQQLRDILEYS
jgi:RNA polymerase sigma-70 factor (ECF subfamily)